MDAREQLDDRLKDRLQDLPPHLGDPIDRFEQIGERVRSRRRRQSAVAVGAVAAVAALAVPLAAQLVPENAAIVPGGGASQTSSPTQDNEPAQSDLPGGTVSTPLSEPRTVTGSGTATVLLGEQPEGATAVSVDLTCLDDGAFWLPDGSGMECPAGFSDVEFEATGTEFVVAVESGQEEIVIDGTAGARWRVTTTYVSTEVSDWGVNAKGETYGVHNENGEPDLIPVIATNGQFGYAYVADMNAASPRPTSPEHALKMQEERAGKTILVPVYESDGETLIGEFVIGGNGDPAILADTATVTVTN